MRSLSTILLVPIELALGLGLGASASTGVDAAACGKTLDSYHQALLSSNDNLSDSREAAYQTNIVNKCDEATFEGLLTGKGYDYTKGPGAIALGDPHNVWVAFGGK